eukprot:1161742-Pelagomonas_calceolata.AAC.4
MRNAPSSMPQLSQYTQDNERANPSLNTGYHIPTQVNSPSMNHHCQTGNTLSPPTCNHTPHGLDTQTNSHRDKRSKLLHISPAIHSLNPLSKGYEVWNYRKNSAKKLANARTASFAINEIYHNDINISHIDGWRYYTDAKKDNAITPIHHQVQYHTHFAPMLIK